MAFWHRGAKPLSVEEISREAIAEARWAAMQPLGVNRQRVVACLFGDMASYGHMFDPEGQTSVLEAFREFVLDRQTRWSSSTELFHHAIVAAGRLLTGDLSGADRIIELLPERAHVTEHGAGKCLLLPSRVLKSVLPLPSDLGNPDSWIAGSHEQAVLRTWLEQQRGRLHWLAAEAEYRLTV